MDQTDSLRVLNAFHEFLRVSLRIHKENGLTVSQYAELDAAEERIKRACDIAVKK